jgi:hypothetical protein
MSGSRLAISDSVQRKEEFGQDEAVVAIDSQVKRRPEVIVGKAKTALVLRPFAQTSNLW